MIKMKLQVYHANSNWSWLIILSIFFNLFILYLMG